MSIGGHKEPSSSVLMLVLRPPTAPTITVDLGVSTFAIPSA